MSHSKSSKQLMAILGAIAICFFTFGAFIIYYIVSDIISTTQTQNVFLDLIVAMKNTPLKNFVQLALPSIALPNIFVWAALALAYNAAAVITHFILIIITSIAYLLLINKRDLTQRSLLLCRQLQTLQLPQSISQRGGGFKV